MFFECLESNISSLNICVVSPKIAFVYYVWEITLDALTTSWASQWLIEPR